MTGFVIAATMVAATGSLIWLIVKACEEGSVLAGVAAIGLVTVMTGSAINAYTNGYIKESEKGPCHEYETRLMYNAATKTMMPSRVCVLRGEWVEPSHDNQ